MMETFGVVPISESAANLYRPYRFADRARMS